MRLTLVFAVLMFLCGSVYGQYIQTQPDAYGFFSDYSAGPLAFEDINNNGNLDMTLGGNFDDFGPFGTLALSFNGGSGNFGSWQNISTTTEYLIKEMEYGFLRGTTERDLVAAFTDHTEVLWNVNNSLTVQQSNLPAGTILSLGRVTDDIYDDLALVSGSNIQIFRNNNTGTFNSTPIQTISEQPGFIRLADLDRTFSFFDLVTQVGSNVKVRKNTSGTFGSPTNISVGSNAIVVEVGDVDNDDYPDLLVVNSNGNLKIHLNDGQGNIHTTPDYTINSSEFNYSITDIAFGDMNNDGWNDLVIAYYEGKITIWINTSAGPYFQNTPQQTIAAFLPYTGVHTIALADVENTGGLSAAISTTFTTIQGQTYGTVYLFKHDGNPAPAPPQNLTAFPSANNHPYLTWDANSEADLSEYNVYKMNGSTVYELYATTSNIYYEDTAEDVVVSRGTGFMAYYRVKAVDLENNISDYSNTASILVEGIPPYKRAATDYPEQIPAQMLLLQNYPNPFNPTTTIEFQIPEENQVELAVFSLTGQKIAVLVNEALDAGAYRFKWNGRDEQGNPVSSGVYIYQMISGEHRLVKKMMLIK